MNSIPEQHDPADDPLTESLLRELIGGESPPDLKDRILIRLLDQSEVTTLSDDAENGIIRVFANDAARPKLMSRVRRRRGNWTNLVISAACLFILISFLGVFAWRRNGPSQIASRPKTARPDPVVTKRMKSSTNQITPRSSIPENTVAEADGQPLDVSQSGNDDTESIAEPDSTESIGVIDAPLFKRSNATATRSEDGDIIAYIDTEMRERWTAGGVCFAEPAKDELRNRVFQKLLGREPSENDKYVPRRELVQRLLTSDQYRPDFERKWSKLLTNLVFQRPEIGELAKDIRVLFRRHLTESLPFDQTVRELVTNSNLNVVQISHAFSGERLICASCHHTRPEARDTEDRYLELTNAFANRQRRAFAEDLSQSDAMRDTIVNRVWWYFYGYGLIVPDADTGNQLNSHPELVDRLTREFLASNYDIRKLVMWIASSEFAFSDYQKTTAAESKLAGITPLARPSRREYLADTIKESLNQVADARKIDLVGDQKRSDAIANRTPSSNNSKQVATKVSEEAWRIAELMNRDADGSKLRLGRSSLLGQIADSQLQSDEQVAHVFFAAVGRHPSREELEVSNRVLRAQPEKPREGLLAIWWSILKSQEGMRP